MSVKHMAVLLVAVLVLVPTVARACQKLDPRPNAKPIASFRDVDRPPEPHLDPADQTVNAFDLFVPILQPIAFLDALEQPLPRTLHSVRTQTLRAPPAAA